MGHTNEVILSMSKQKDFLSTDKIARNDGSSYEE